MSWGDVAEFLLPRLCGGSLVEQRSACQEVLRWSDSLPTPIRRSVVRWVAVRVLGRSGGAVGSHACSAVGTLRAPLGLSRSAGQWGVRLQRLCGGQGSATGAEPVKGRDGGVVNSRGCAAACRPGHPCACQEASGGATGSRACVAAVYLPRALHLSRGPKAELAPAPVRRSAPPQLGQWRQVKVVEVVSKPEPPRARVCQSGPSGPCTQGRPAGWWPQGGRRSSRSGTVGSGCRTVAVAWDPFEDAWALGAVSRVALGLLTTERQT